MPYWGTVGGGTVHRLLPWRYRRWLGGEVDVNEPFQGLCGRPMRTWDGVSLRIPPGRRLCPQCQAHAACGTIASATAQDILHVQATQPYAVPVRVMHDCEGKRVHFLAMR